MFIDQTQRVTAVPCSTYVSRIGSALIHRRSWHLDVRSR